MKSLSYYVKLVKPVEANPSVNIVNVFIRQATTVQCSSICCFSMSCMCCCCCTKSAQECLNISELGNHWKQALLAYKDLTPVQTRDLFLKGMAMLIRLDTNLKATLSTPSSDSFESFHKMLFLQTVNEGQWIGDFLKKIKMAFQFPSGQQNEYQGISISKEDMTLAMACLPFFYPTLCERYYYRLDSTEMAMIDQCIKSS